MYRLLGRVVRHVLPLTSRGCVAVVRLTALSSVVLVDAAYCISLWAVEVMEPTSKPLAVSAEEEYRKNPGLQKKDIRQLEEWLTTQKHLPAVTEEMLAIFHHSCYYDLERTRACIENYYTMRTRMTEFFTNRDVTTPELTNSVETLNVAPLPVPDPKNGNLFMYYGLRTSDTSNYVFVDAVKLGLMGFDAFTHENGTMPGFEIIFDMEGTRIGHILRIKLSALRKYTQYLQEANPIRLKAIHMVNANFLLDRALFLAKPFLKKELYEVIHVHKPGSESLCEHIPRECLPAELGGTLESKDVYCAALIKTLERLKDFFKADESLRVDETLREKKKKNRENPAAAPDPEVEEEKLNIQ